MDLDPCCCGAGCPCCNGTGWVQRDSQRENRMSALKLAEINYLCDAGWKCKTDSQDEYWVSPKYSHKNIRYSVREALAIQKQDDATDQYYGAQE